jgi:hypothetical protein
VPPGDSGRQTSSFVDKNLQNIYIYLYLYYRKPCNIVQELLPAISFHEN